VKKLDPKPQRRAKKKPGSLCLDELSAKEAERAARAGVVVMLPIGSVEGPGDHLPTCTDSLQPEYVALEVARNTRCLVALPLRFGAVMLHAISRAPSQYSSTHCTALHEISLQN
jgi:creatinine amidohydrolase/Fe(II)-dependent formamide hydrolase-like protein